MFFKMSLMVVYFIQSIIKYCMIPSFRIDSYIRIQEICLKLESSLGLMTNLYTITISQILKSLSKAMYPANISRRGR